MIRSAALVLAGTFVLSASVAFAQGPSPLPLPLPLPFPNFQGTPEEQKACRPDVVRMCKDFGPAGFLFFRTSSASSPACRRTRSG